MAAPVSALQIQRKIEEEKALRLRRQAIFNTLWVNRRRQFWIARIDALNMIAIEFVGQQGVLDAWEALFAHYVKNTHPGSQEQIFNEREGLYADLLYEMSKVLKYRFSRTIIRESAYRPEFHSEMDTMEVETRRSLHQLLKLNALPVRFVGAETNPTREATTQIHDGANATVLPDTPNEPPRAAE